MTAAYLPGQHAKGPLVSAGLFRTGAVEKTRTSTGLPPQRPQRCASTNSATAARFYTLVIIPVSKDYKVNITGIGEKLANLGLSSRRSFLLG